MSDSKRVTTPAVDDVDFIARRLAQIEAERAAAIADTELPSDVEPSGFGLIPIAREMTLEETFADSMTGKLDEFWDKLVEEGILKRVK